MARDGLDSKPEVGIWGPYKYSYITDIALYNHLLVEQHLQVCLYHIYIHMVRPSHDPIVWQEKKRLDYGLTSINHRPSVNSLMVDWDSIHHKSSIRCIPIRYGDSCNPGSWGLIASVTRWNVRYVAMSSQKRLTDAGPRSHSLDQGTGWYCKASFL